MKALVLSLAVLLLLSRTDVVAGQTPSVTVDPHEAVAVLSGPWRFRVGDDPRWADPALDDSGWEVIDLQTSSDAPLGLLGPWAVDSAYQVYENGRLLGGVGNFSGATPVAYGSHYPKFFGLLPLTAATASSSRSGYGWAPGARQLRQLAAFTSPPR